MTTRKLTPAEALECLRDRRAVDRAELSSTMFYDRWGTFDHAVWSAIAALEEALAQKPTAAPAKRGRHRIRQMLNEALNDGDKEASAMLQQALLWKNRQPVAGEVMPSDEEIVAAIKRSETWGDKTSYSALRLLARRIGVQGVPQ